MRAWIENPSPHQLPEGQHRADGFGWMGGVLADDPMSMMTTLRLGRPGLGGGAEFLVGMDRHGAIVESAPDDGTNVNSVVRIPTRLAMALLDALAQHFGGTGDTRTLRRDYDAERARVDRLIEALIEPPPVPVDRVAVR